jgi:hypothetical protein
MTLVSRTPAAGISPTMTTVRMMECSATVKNYAIQILTVTPPETPVLPEQSVMKRCRAVIQLAV